MPYAARVCPDGRIQTVKEHTDGVCQKAEKDARRFGTRAMTRLICLLHDMGKNTAYSNLYQDTVGAGEPWEKDKPIHSHAGARLIAEDYGNGSTDMYAVLLSELSETVIMAHHGLFDCLHPDGQNQLLRKIQNCDYDFEEARRLLDTEMISSEQLDSLVKAASAEMQALFHRLRAINPKKTEFAFYMSMLFRMQLSILVNADHADAAAFATGERAPSADGNTALWEACSTFLEQKLSAFENKTEIQAIRGEISRRLLEKTNEQQRIVRLTIPTGGGKTLSGLRYAVHYAKRFDKSRILYVAPFNSILEQNAAVFRRFLPDDTEILEHYGDVLDDEERFRYYAENWSAPVIATSMVQFFNTLFLGKISSVRRMRGLLHAVIIIDEVQSVPVECVTLFDLAVNFLAEICGCTVVLCSATQPTLSEEIKHPLLLSAKDELVENRLAYTEAFRRTEVVDKLTSGGYTYAQAADFAMEKAEAAKSVLLIVNTKEAAKTIYALLKERLPKDVTIVHLSTQMCPSHRKSVLAALKKHLDKGDRTVCVSTQLIEAGVNISFETVIRSLAGLDSIIQSAGRCNRNCEAKLGHVYVIRIADENISRIKAIKIGAAITERLMMTIRANPLLFSGDLTGNEAINRYYRDYFNAFKNELDFPVTVDNIETSIFELLSTNQKAFNSQKALNMADKPNRFMNQAFQTAGMAFKVIDDYAQTVLVPYGKGKDYICKICSDHSLLPSAALFRKLQPFTIGLSDRQCEDRVTRHEDTGILILKEGFYNDEYGFDPDGEQDLLLF